MIESASLRLRPIIMTSISAAAGSIPLIVWGGAGGESRKTIGVTIFYGAIFATLVTLFVVPVAYSVVARKAHVEAHGMEALPAHPPGHGAPAHGD